MDQIIKANPSKWGKLITKPEIKRRHDLLQSLQNIRDSLKKIKEGADYALSPLSVQLRALLFRNIPSRPYQRRQLPLLFDVAEQMRKYDYDAEIIGQIGDMEKVEEDKKEITIYATPECPIEEMPIIKKDLRLMDFHIGRRKKKKSNQIEILFEEWLIKTIGAYHEVEITPMDVIRGFADTSGGAHYDKSIPEGFAEFLTAETNGAPVIINTLVQIGRVTYEIGQELIRELCDLELHVFAEISKKERINSQSMLFDLVYPDTKIRFSIFIDQNKKISIRGIGFSGNEGLAESQEMFEWDGFHHILFVMRVLDDLEAELSIFIDGKEIANKKVGMAIFVVNDLDTYDVFINRSIEDPQSGISFGFLASAAYNRILSAKERKQVSRAFFRLSKTIFPVFFSKGGFAHSPAGRSDFNIYGNYVPKTISAFKNHAN